MPKPVICLGLMCAHHLRPVPGYYRQLEREHEQNLLLHGHVPRIARDLHDRAAAVDERLCFLQGYDYLRQE